MYYSLYVNNKTTLADDPTRGRFIDLIMTNWPAAYQCHIIRNNKYT